MGTAPPARKERPRRNEEIRVREVHVVDSDGANRGTVPIAEALRLAQEAGLDLVEISPDATPPVCKLVDYGKFK
jgi:translation initiation factor IF-3